MIWSDAPLGAGQYIPRDVGHHELHALGDVKEDKGEEGKDLQTPKRSRCVLELRIQTPETVERVEALARESDRRCPQLGLFHQAKVPMTQTWTRDGEALFTLTA